MGGLHKFMAWRRAILTDSGGFQVFSLSELRKVADEGVTFRSHLDGSEHFLSPEKALEIEIALGADIVMVLDECIEAPAPEQRAREAAKRTLDWARRSRDYFAQHGDAARQMLFGIVQGGTHAALRRASADALVKGRGGRLGPDLTRVGAARSAASRWVSRTRTPARWRMWRCRACRRIVHAT